MKYVQHKVVTKERGLKAGNGENEGDLVHVYVGESAFW